MRTKQEVQIMTIKAIFEGIARTVKAKPKKARMQQPKIAKECYAKRKL